MQESQVSLCSLIVESRRGTSSQILPHCRPSTFLRARKNIYSRDEGDPASGLQQNFITLLSHSRSPACHTTPGCCACREVRKGALCLFPSSTYSLPIFLDSTSCLFSLAILGSSETNLCLFPWNLQLLVDFWQQSKSCAYLTYHDLSGT